MPKLTKPEVPILLPFAFHGVSFGRETSTGQAIGNCPFCGEDRKFYVNESTGQWDCKDCKVQGNHLTFLRQLYDLSTEPEDVLRELAEDRKLLRWETLQAWGVKRSCSTGEILVPAFSWSGELCQLYRYTYLGGKRRLLATEGLPHGLFGVPLAHPGKEFVSIFEGPWDAMAYWEVAQFTALRESGETELTAITADTIAATHNILAAPGCKVFYEGWYPLFDNKRVSFFFDNDHPRMVTMGDGATTRIIPPDSFEGIKSAANIMSHMESPPLEVKYLKWGKDDDYDPQLKHGYDVRDHITLSDTSEGRVSIVGDLHRRLCPIPADWMGGKTFRDGSVRLDPLQCESWLELIKCWKDALEWSDGLHRALATMLAVVVSTGHVGDQLWLKVIGPPSCGKSTLCEAISVSKDFVRPQSTIRGFMSGYKSDKDGTEDHSLIPKIAGKTLIFKDADALFTSSGIQATQGEMRDLYDRVSRPNYKNGIDRVYENISTTIIICGTGALMGMDASELGERFLTIIILKDLTAEKERSIARKSSQNIRNHFGRIDSKDNPNSETPEKIKARRMTGGYVEYLRKNAVALYQKVTMSDRAVEHCLDCAEFVAFMRARPSTRQDETAEREISTRLGNQMTLLAGSLAVVLGRKQVDVVVLEHIRKMALDTADGKTMELLKYLYRAGSDGVPISTLSVYTGRETEDVQELLNFLGKIGAAVAFKQEQYPGVEGHIRWSASPRLVALYSRLVEVSN